MSERISWLDALKGVGIFLVIYCHHVFLTQDAILGNVLMALTSIAVPCFLMVSGALLHKREAFSFRRHLKRMGTLYGVLVAWRVIYLLFTVVAFRPTLRVASVVQYLFFFDSLEPVPSSVMWYIAAFLLVLAVFPLSHHLLHHGGEKGYLWLLGLSFLGGFFVPVLNTLFSVLGDALGVALPQFDGLWLVLPFQQYANFLFFFLLGGFLFFYHEKWQARVCRKGLLFPILAAVIGTAGILLLKFTLTGTFRWHGIYMPNGYECLSTILAALGFWFLFSSASLPFFTPLFAKIGQNTLGIYYMHYLLLAVVRHLFYDRMTPFFGSNLIKTILALAICTLLTLLLKKIPLLRRLV